MSPKLPNLKRLTELPSGIRLAAIGVVVAVLVLVGLPVFAGSSNAFFSRYHSLAKSFSNLETSSHKDVDCAKCHVDPRGPVVYRLALAADFYVNLPKKQKSPVFVKFAKPTREACLSCHREGWSEDSKRTAKVPHPAHLRVASETRECVKCHKWTAHEETYMQKHKQMPFSGVCVAYGCHVGVKTRKDCYTCHHVLAETSVTWKTDHPQIAQTVGSNACLESCHEAAQCRLCHTTGKRPEFTGLATQTGLKAIESQHVKSTWIKRHGTLALEDQSKCMKCHVSDGECRDCHSKRPAFHGAKSTWIGTHKKVAKDERQCLACHKKPFCNDCHKQFKEMR